MELDTKVAVLGARIDQFDVLYPKLEIAIEKIGDVANSITRMLAVHEERHNAHDRTEDELYALLDARKREMHDELDKLHSRISVSDKSHVEGLNSSKAEILAAIKDVKKTFAEDLNKQTAAVDKLETRISSLERWRWVLMGAGIGAGWLFGNISKLGGFFQP